MEEAEGHGLREPLKVELVHLSDVPAELMCQKESIDLDRWYEWADAQPPESTARALLMSDEEGPIAVLTMLYSPMYDGLATESFVVHRRVRGNGASAEVIRRFAPLVVRYGKFLGASHVAVQTAYPRTVQKAIGMKGSTREKILRIDLEG